MSFAVSPALGCKLPGSSSSLSLARFHPLFSTRFLRRTLGPSRLVEECSSVGLWVGVGVPRVILL
jgi:hypothetical protein